MKSVPVYVTMKKQMKFINCHTGIKTRIFFITNNVDLKSK